MHIALLIFNGEHQKLLWVFSLIKHIYISLLICSTFAPMDHVETTLANGRKKCWTNPSLKFICSLILYAYVWLTCIFLRCRLTCWLKLSEDYNSASFYCTFFFSRREGQIGSDQGKREGKSCSRNSLIFLVILENNLNLTWQQRHEA